MLLLPRNIIIIYFNCGNDTTCQRLLLSTNKRRWIIKTFGVISKRIGVIDAGVKVLAMWVRPWPNKPWRPRRIIGVIIRLDWSNFTLLWSNIRAAHELLSPQRIFYIQKAMSACKSRSTESPDELWDSQVHFQPALAGRQRCWSISQTFWPPLMCSVRDRKFWEIVQALRFYMFLCLHLCA